MPSEKVEPTNMPATTNKASVSQAFDSKNVATKNDKPPPLNAIINTFFRPIRSLSSPSGNCVAIAPIEKAARI